MALVGLVALPVWAGSINPAAPFIGGGSSSGVGVLPAIDPPGVLYDNGGINGTITAFSITGAYGWLVSDSFTLTGASTVTGAQHLGLWVFPGDTPMSLDWSITSAPDGGTVYASGASAALTSSYWGVGFDYYSIFDSSFSIPTVGLAAGTYYLNLTNAVTNVSGDPTYWDENNGPATAYQFQYDVNQGGIGSEAFQITGSSGPSIPEPASLVLLGSGLLLQIGRAHV